MRSRVPTSDAAPSPARVRSYDELAERLRALRGWSGVSYRELHRRVVRARRERGVPELPVFDTVYRCLQPGRRRLDTELVVEIATTLLEDESLADEWRQACHGLADRADDAAVVRTSDVLPDDLPRFVGRADELERLLAIGAGTDANAAGGRAAIVALQGMAGVGKTRLAVHAAHRLLRARRYGDTQLFVDLRGFDTERLPADPMAVLDGFLRRLGVPGNQIHALDLARRTTKLRELLRDKRALLVLDNAADDEQIRPLLPDGPGCLVLVTSRRRLTGLRDASHLALDIFAPADALALLRSGGRADLVDADPEAAANLAGLVGHLPLALGLVASELEASPDWTLLDHIERLTERRSRLRLDDGVQLALAASYETLHADHKRLLRSLASHPGRDIDRYAAAALTGGDPDRAARQLTELSDRNLLQQRDAWRYELHDLVRVYATSLATETDRPADRRAALGRLLNYYQRTAALAMRQCAPYERPLDVGAATSAVPAPAFDDRGTATEWLDAERANLIATALHAADDGGEDRVGEFAIILFRYLLMGSHLQETEILHGHALETAAPRLRGPILVNTAALRIRQGRYSEAERQLQAAAELSRELDDGATELGALATLGGLHSHRGQFQRAEELLRRTLELARERGDRFREGRALNALGTAISTRGQYTAGLNQHMAALAIARELGDPRSEMLALVGVGALYSRLERHDDAISTLRQAVDIARAIGARPGEAVALNQLGLATVRAGRADDGLDQLREALRIVRAHGDRIALVHTLNNLGDSLSQHGEPEQAVGRHREALTIARACGLRHQHARALDGLGRAAFETGDLDAARGHWTEAHGLYQELGTPEAERVGTRLAELANASDVPAN